MTNTEHFLCSSRVLWDLGNYRDSISRLYYAVLHCICDSLLIIYGLDIKPSHRYAHKMFTTYDRSVNLFILQEWQRIRENVDYERRADLQKFSKDELLPYYLVMTSFVLGQQSKQIQKQQNKIDKMDLF